MEPLASERVKAVFESALERTTPAERAAFLDEACEGDSALRQRVDALLRAHEQPDPLLDRSAAELLNAQADDADGIDDWLEFLQPPSKPGSLGRLGHYEVLEVAGRGGMGIVFRAFDDKLQRVVAIKALAPALAGSARARQQFVREARAAAAVTHENVIAIYAVEDAGPVPYLVMHFVGGKSLDQKIEQQGTLPLNAILRIGLHVAEGLAAAHRQGLVHRDVKPANILLENGVERVKITDFGLARAGGDAVLTHSGLLTGTPTYMSPEQACGEAVDARSDLFSLGSVLYAMCTGKPPFGASSALAVLNRVCEETPRSIRQVNPELPAWLDELVSRLHAKNPADRPASAREVADELEHRLAELQTGGSTRSTTIPPEAPATNQPRRRRVAVAAVAVLLVALAALALTEATGVTRIRRALTRTTSQGDSSITQQLQPRATSPDDDAAAAAKAAEAEWEQTVARLPPDEQAKAVAERLKARNPEFDGAFTHKSAGVVVTEYQFSSEHVSDISPVRALRRLSGLTCSAPRGRPGPLADLSPLEGMRLTNLVCLETQVSDLSPLKGMPLIGLDCSHTPVSDLSPLAGMPLTHLFVSHSRVADLSPLKGLRLQFILAEGIPVADVSPLKGMPLTYLGLYMTKVSDLSPLQGMPLEYLNLTGLPISDVSVLKDMKTLRRLVLDRTQVSDLSPLKGLALDNLDIRGLPVTDLSPLKGMALKQIGLDYQPARDAETLRSMTSLRHINGVPAAEFLKAQGP